LWIPVNSGISVSAPEIVMPGPDGIMLHGAGGEHAAH